MLQRKDATNIPNMADSHPLLPQNAGMKDSPHHRQKDTFALKGCDLGVPWNLLIQTRIREVGIGGKVGDPIKVETPLPFNDVLMVDVILEPGIDSFGMRSPCHNICRDIIDVEGEGDGKVLQRCVKLLRILRHSCEAINKR